MVVSASDKHFAKDEISTDHAQWKHSVAGLGAGCISAVVTCPLDVVKTRLQHQSNFTSKFNPAITLSNYPPSYRPYHGTFPTLRRIYLEEGIRGNFRGLGPSLLGYLPSWGIYFTFYEYFKSKLSGFDERYLPLVHTTSAMLAGAMNTTITNPIWVIKTRLMTQSIYTSYHYKSTWDAFHTLWKDEGFRGYYRGLGPSLIGTVHVAIQFPLYESFKLHLLQQRAEAELESYQQNVTNNSNFENHKNVQLKPIDFLLASVGSKLLATTATYPHEVIRTRMQTEKTHNYSSILETAKRIYGEHGLRTFYRGWGTNILRVTPANAITLVTYELLLRAINNLYSK